MIAIPGGTFRMGSPRGSGLLIERPDHQVTLHDFLLGQFEVTQGQYFDITGMRPSSCRTNPELRGPEGWKSLPVEMVNWYEALIFCNKLSLKEKLKPVYRVNGKVNPDDWGTAPTDEETATWHVEWVHGANGYRLPTESEWEYAARGGSESQNFKYAGGNTPDDVLWYYENSETQSHQIGKKAPNELGLYDMSGNVMEWCWDWQGVYTAAAKENPLGPHSGLYRIIRGGGWSYAVEYCLVAHRHNNLPYYRGVNLGFRVARSE
jgi:formylglycine-generating enzyme required for sulfatase activity